MRKWMKQILSVSLCAVMVLTAVLANTSVANAEEEKTYNVDAEFLKEDGTASSAYDAIVGQKAVVKVKADGTMSATLNLQAASGMNFYNFKYSVNGDAKDEASFEAASYTGAEEAPESITIPELPDTTGIVVMKTTYLNPVMGPHEVTVYLHLDLEDVLKDINNTDDEELDEDEENENDEDDEDEDNNENENNDVEQAGTTYTVDAEFLKEDGTASSAYDAIVGQKAVVKVKADGTMSATLNLQAASGMNFYNFKYSVNGDAKDEASFEAASYTGAEEAPESITIPELPDTTGVVVMRTTYLNPVMGPHEVTVYLHLDLEDVLKDEEGSGNEEDPDDTEVPDNEDNDGDGSEDEQNNSEAELDIYNLEDGIYEVPVALWNASTDQPSMGAAGLLGATDEDPWSTARIVVEEGEYVMYIYTQEMQFGVLTARLQSFQVEGVNAKTVGTEWEDPTAFYFTMPYVDKNMNVAINTGEGSVMGNNYIAARQKTDWDEIVRVADDTDVTEAPESEAVIDPIITTPVTDGSDDTTTTTTADATTTTTAAAQTGDTTSVFVYIMAMMLALFAAAYGTKNKWMTVLKK